MKNLLTIHAEEMELIFDAISRRSQKDFMKIFYEDLQKIFWQFETRTEDLSNISKRFGKKLFVDILKKIN